MKIIARVYDTYGQARQVVADLEASGVAASNINLIANKYVCDESAHIQEPSAAGPGAGVGAALGGTAGLLAGLGIIAGWLRFSASWTVTSRSIPPSAARSIPAKAGSASIRRPRPTRRARPRSTGCAGLI